MATLANQHRFFSTFSDWSDLDEVYLPKPGNTLIYKETRQEKKKKVTFLTTVDSVDTEIQCLGIYLKETKTLT